MMSLGLKVFFLSYFLFVTNYNGGSKDYQTQCPHHKGIASTERMTGMTGSMKDRNNKEDGNNRNTKNPENIRKDKTNSMVTRGGVPTTCMGGAAAAAGDNKVRATPMPMMTKQKGNNEGQ
jgi:hypothetical protein